MQCYNTSGGYLSMPIAEVLKNVEASLERGIGGIKLTVLVFFLRKVGIPIFD